MNKVNIVLTRSCVETEISPCQLNLGASTIDNPLLRWRSVAVISGEPCSDLPYFYT